MGYLYSSIRLILSCSSLPHHSDRKTTHTTSCNQRHPPVWILRDRSAVKFHCPRNAKTRTPLLKYLALASQPRAELSTIIRLLCKWPKAQLDKFACSESRGQFLVLTLRSTLPLRLTQTEFSIRMGLPICVGVLTIKPCHQTPL